MQTTLSDDENSDEDKEEMNRKFQEKLKQRKNFKKMSRQGISAEVYGAFNKKQEFVPKMIEKSNETKETIRALLK